MTIVVKYNVKQACGHEPHLVFNDLLIDMAPFLNFEHFLPRSGLHNDGQTLNSMVKDTTP